jgi:hypothetical protein
MVARNMPVLARPQRDLIIRIHIKHSDRSPAYCRLANHIDSLQAEMLAPFLASRMKEFCHFIRLRIDSRQVRSLVQIAIDAGESKVVEFVGSAVNPWNDVLDVKRGQRRIILMQMAILASILSALANLGSGLRSDHLRLGVRKLLGLSFENGDELVCANIARVLRPLVFGEFAFS